jgi:hypothetical protein
MYHIMPLKTVDERAPKAIVATNMLVMEDSAMSEDA